MSKYKVFSAFDGIGSGQIALNREGIQYDDYYASEIDKLAMQIANKNYPNTIQLGDIKLIKANDLPKIDLLMGGSPCQGFSKAGKQENFNDPRSRLVYDFAELYAELDPTYFILENVYMKKAYQDIITALLGVEPICINSNLVSAQNRKRLYWTNIPVVGLPKDRNIYLKDIVEDDVHPYAFTERRTEEAKRIRREYQKNEGKDYCPRRAKEIVKRTDGKFNCLTATFSEKEHMLELKTGGKRKVSPLECERLQTVPNNKIKYLSILCYDQAKYYVNAVNQNPKLLKLVLNAEQSELNELVKNVVLSMNANHRLIRHIVPQNADIWIPKQTKKCMYHNQKENYLHVKNVAKNVMFNYLNIEGVFVVENAFINITEGKITHCGMEEALLNVNHYISQTNGNQQLVLSGKEIMRLVEDVEKNLNIKSDKSIISTMSYHSNIKNIEQMLIIYYLFAKNVIIGYTQGIIPKKSILLNFNTIFGYTEGLSDSQRRKLIGNGWTIDIVAYILSFIPKEL